jgi:hypothetical protein
MSEHNTNSSLSYFYNRGRVPSSILLKFCVGSRNKVYKFYKIVDLLDFNVYFVLKQFCKFVIQVVLLF